MANRSRTPGELGRIIDDWRAGQFSRPSSAAIAAKVGVSRTTVSEWEAGKRRPEPEHLDALAKELRLPIEMLAAAAERDALHERRRRAERAALTQEARRAVAEALHDVLAAQVEDDVILPGDPTPDPRASTGPGAVPRPKRSGSRSQG